MDARSRSGEAFEVIDVYLEDSNGRRRTVIPRPKWWAPWRWFVWLFRGEYVCVCNSMLVRVRK